MRTLERTRHRPDHDPARADADVGAAGRLHRGRDERSALPLHRPRSRPGVLRRQRRHREADRRSRQPVLRQHRADVGAGDAADVDGVQAGDRRRRLHVAAAPPRALPASQLSSYHCAASGQDASRPSAATATRSCSAPTRPAIPTDVRRPTTIKTGPYEGLIAQQMPYQLDVTAKTRDRRRSAPGSHDGGGGDSGVPVRHLLRRRPVLLRAADDFNFGGRVHTNGNLFLSEANGNTLTLTDKVTAVKEVVRQRL